MSDVRHAIWFNQDDDSSQFRQMAPSLQYIDIRDSHNHKKKCAVEEATSLEELRAALREHPDAAIIISAGAQDGPLAVEAVRAAQQSGGDHELYVVDNIAIRALEAAGLDSQIIDMVNAGSKDLFKTVFHN